MKLNRWDRLGVAVFAALGMVVLAFVFACAVAPEFGARTGAAFARLVQDHDALRAALAVACLALAVFICSRAWGLIRGRDEENGAEPIDLAAGESGSVMMSPSAMETIVRQAVSPIEGVARVGVRLAGGADALNVALEMSVKPGTKIPDLARTVRGSVRQTLDELTGVNAAAVTLTIVDIAPGAAVQIPDKKG